MLKVYVINIQISPNQTRPTLLANAVCFESSSYVTPQHIFKQNGITAIRSSTHKRYLTDSIQHADCPLSAQ
jgi:hypothetical protein